jgi:hypothetical protein
MVDILDRSDCAAKRTAFVGHHGIKKAQRLPRCAFLRAYRA